MRPHLCIATICFATLLSQSASADSVSAFISGGTLFVIGDNNPNSIQISSNGPNSIRVRGVNSASGQPTTVNGMNNGTAMLNGWTGGVFVYMHGGDDEVTLFDLSINGSTHIDLGFGDDDCFIGQPSRRPTALAPLDEEFEASVEIKYTLVVLGSNGDDGVFIHDTYVKGYTTIDTGWGSDWVDIGSSMEDAAFFSTLSLVSNFYGEGEGEGFGNNWFNNSLAIYPGAGEDSVNIYSTYVHYDCIIDDWLDPLNLRIDMSEIGRNLFIYGTPQRDNIQLYCVDVRWLMDIFSEGALDRISVEDSSSHTANIYSGTGEDRVDVHGLRNNYLTINTGPDSDYCAVRYSRLMNYNGFGDGGNDEFVLMSVTAHRVNLFGGWGHDSLSHSGNSIWSLNYYSFEEF